MAIDIKLAMQKHIEAFEEQAKNRKRYEPIPEHAFPAPSLGAWLRVAREAGVAFVPAETLAEVSIESIMNFERPSEDDIVELNKVRAANENLPEGHMLRWDCCSPYGIKMAMNEGRDSAPDRRHLMLDIDDPRFFDIIYEFPKESVAILSRPWIKPLMHGTHPVEFRVFVKDGETIGISNYQIAPKCSIHNSPVAQQH